MAFNLASPVVSRHRVEASFVTDMKDYKNQVLEVYSKCKKHGIKSSFSLTIPHCLFSIDELAQLSETQSFMSGCQVLHGLGIVFKTNGAIASCTHLSDFELADAKTTSDILNSSDSFLKYWNSKKLEITRQKANCYRSDECHKCNRWSDCGGGCLVHWAYHRPDTVNLHHFV